MAKNNAKGDLVFKADNDVVCLREGVPNSGKKVVVRRSLPTRSASIQLQSSKCTSANASGKAISKTIQIVTPTTHAIVTAAPLVTTPLKCDSVVNIVAPVITLSNTPNLKPVKLGQPRSTQSVLKRNLNNPGTSATGTVVKRNKVIVAQQVQKQGQNSNGQVINTTTTAGPRRRAVPTDLTITPVTNAASILVDAKFLTESSIIYTPGTKAIEVTENEPGAAKPILSKASLFTNKSMGVATITKKEVIYQNIIPNIITVSTEQIPLPLSKPVTTNTRGRPKGSKNKVYEPVCLTISSDDDDPPEEIDSFTNNMHPQNLSVNQRDNYVNIQESPSTLPGGDPSSKATAVQRRVTDDADEDGDLEDEIVEEDEDEDGELLDGNSNPMYRNNVLTKCVILKCRSIRIGSFKIHPLNDQPHIDVTISREMFQFQVPAVKNRAEMVTVTLRKSDVQQVLGHFGRCLPIIFIFNKSLCGERLRSKLGMVKGEVLYFDPDGQDDRQKIITFLIDSISDDHRHFLRHFFPGEGLLKEVDQKVANEILVKSTPQQAGPSMITIPGTPQLSQTLQITQPAQITQATKLSLTPTQSNMLIQATPVTFTATTTPVVAHIQNIVATPLIVQTVPVKVSPVVKKPEVTKVLTYSSSQDRITITSDDLMCLEEGEFLNDVIIDFYLSYLFHEKLSERDRERTHIFNSFFYPHLTNVSSSKNSIRLRSGEECSSSMAAKRHAQVRTWTKNVDIFEKDFIIIPINQKVHWFLAIICFPSLVPELPVKNKVSKSAESVSSTDERSCPSPERTQTNASPVSSQVNSEQACSTTDDQNSDDSSNISNDAESSFQEEPLPDAPDSSTHPDKNGHHDKMPCILIFDSLSGPNRWRIVATLREYLDVEWQIKKGTQKDFSRTAMRGHVPNVPQQTNYSDCGVYVLQYVESFFENPFPHFSNHMPQLPNWFAPEMVSNKREEIKDMINELTRRQSPNPTNTKTRGTPKKDNSKLVCSPKSSPGQRVNQLTNS